MSNGMKFIIGMGIVSVLNYGSVFAGEEGKTNPRPNAGDRDGHDRPRPPHAGGPIEFILTHSEEFKLTEEQKVKLLALQKDFKEKEKNEETRKEVVARLKEILTPEQEKELREAREKHEKGEHPEPKKQ